MLENIPIYGTAFLFIVIILGIWELIWKGIALWKCGRRNQLTWFVFILIFNTIGILPIVYLILNKDISYGNRKKKVHKKTSKKRKTKK